MIIDWNEGWRFWKEGDSDSVPVTLPHDAMQTEQRRASCRNGVNTGYFPGGVYLYEKVFSVNEPEQSHVIHFEGVYQNCTVTVNGRMAGRHRYGYTGFDVDISDLIVQGRNRVEVRVDNSLEPNCRWYSGSGIYRPVTLLVRKQGYIRKVHIETVSIHPAVIRVEADADIVEIIDGETLVASAVPGEIMIPDAKLWNAENPYLYRCVVKNAVDEKAVSFGIRELKWSAESGLTVNGERVLLRGGCIHHDHGVLGAREYPEAEERRIRILRESGFNAVRIAHHPASQITLDVCDRLGMYVMNETFDGWYTPKTYHDYSRWFTEEWRRDLEAMVESARNHPCVILYSIGNEVTETASEKGIALCREMTAFVHRLDPSRPVTAGVNVLLNVYNKLGMGVYKERGDYKASPLPEGKEYREKKTGSAFFNAAAGKLGRLMFFMSGGKKGDLACHDAADALDIIGLNYASSRYDEDVHQYPDRMMVGSETMAADLPYNWDRVKKYPQLIGDFVWSAWDYLGEACIGDWTYHSYPGLPLLAGQGMIDITGSPLASMAFMQIVWGLRKEPFIAVRPLNHAAEQPSKGAWQFTNAIDSWTWHGYEGTRATVEVYADAAAVRVTLNGRVIQTKAIKKFKAIFHVPYEPGVLTAEGLDFQGHITSSCSLRSGSTETVLNVSPEKKTAKPAGIVYIPIEFTDHDGNLKPYMEQRVDLTVRGAELLGFGSAQCKTDEGFDKLFHNAYRGRTLAVVRVGTDNEVTITASSEGVPTAQAKIEVQA